MSSDDVVKSVRRTIANIGGSELQVISNDEYMLELFARKQKVLAEMNAAKKKAAEEAAKPYLTEIADLDQQYAMILVLTGDNKE